MIRALIFTLLAGQFTTAFAFTPMQNSSQVRAPSALAMKGPVIYYGGPVLSAVKVYAVFWGPKVDKEVVAKIGPFYQSFVNSSFIDLLKQYATKDQKIGHGTYGGSKTITPHNQSKKLLQAQIEAEIITQIDEGALPKPDANTLFMIHFPAGIKITAFGSDSCTSWCGDHEAIKNSKYGNVPYAMIPDMNGACSFGCGGSPFLSMTITTSHEITEAITDPVSPAVNEPNVFPAAWLSADQNEVSDLCVDSNSTLKAGTNTYTLQDVWSNTSNQCVAGTYTSQK